MKKFTHTSVGLHRLSCLHENDKPKYSVNNQTYNWPNCIFVIFAVLYINTFRAYKNKRYSHFSEFEICYFYNYVNKKSNYTKLIYSGINGLNSLRFLNAEKIVIHNFEYKISLN